MINLQKHKNALHWCSLLTAVSYVPWSSLDVEDIEDCKLTLYRWCTVVSGHWDMMNPRLKMSHDGAARVRHFPTEGHHISMSHKNVCICHTLTTHIIVFAMQTRSSFIVITTDTIPSRQQSSNKHCSSINSQLLPACCSCCVQIFIWPNLTKVTVAETDRQAYVQSTDIHRVKRRNVSMVTTRSPFCGYNME